MKKKLLVLCLGVSLLGGCRIFSEKDQKVGTEVKNSKTEEVKVAEAKSGDTVKIHYTGKLKDGKVFDTSEKREPLKFTIGEKQVIPGFEEGVIGMQVGDEKVVNIPVDKAYGLRREELVQDVERKNFPSDMELKIGQRLQVQQPNGQPVVVMVTALTEEKVSLDANHPLAGQELTFDIKLVEII